MTDNNNSWEPWSKFVLEELKRLNISIEKIQHEKSRVDIELREMRLEIERMNERNKTLNRVYATASGIVGGAITLLVNYWSKLTP